MLNGSAERGGIVARPKGTTKEPGRLEWLKMFPEMQWLDDENMAVRAAGFDLDGCYLHEGYYRLQKRHKQERRGSHKDQRGMPGVF